MSDDPPLSTPEDQPTLMHNLEAILQERLDDPYFNNAVAAHQLGISTRSLYRAVKAASGMSPNQYFRRYRIERADELLRSGRYRTVKEVAMRVGFQKVSYFSDQFERLKGVRPSELLRARNKL